MASIQKKTSKTGQIAYKITVSMGRGSSGKQLLKSKTFIPDPSKTARQNEKMLRKFADEFEEKCKTGRICGEELDLQAFAEQWFETYCKENLETTTVRKYEYLLSAMVYPVFGHMKLNEFRPLLIQQKFQDLQKSGYTDAAGQKRPYSDRTIRTVRQLLSSILSAAVEDGILPYNPCGRQRQRHRNVQNEEVRCFSPEQAARFLEIIEKPIPVIVPAHTVKRNGKPVVIREYQKGFLNVQLKYRTLFTVCLFSGMRRQELIALKWKNVDFQNSTVRIESAAAYNPKDGQYEKVPKSKSGYRTIKLPPVCMELLKLQRKDIQRDILKLGTAWEGPRDIDENFVFVQDTGKMMHIHTPRQELKRVLETYNRQCEPENALPLISFHELRHTSASLLISQGVDITSVAARLGHSDATTTLRVYAHAFEERDSAASEALENILINRRKFS